jgi:hypothetical protein
MVNIGGGILDVISGVLGAADKPVVVLLLAYIFPLLLVFLTLSDLLFGFGFFRKRSAQAIALIIAFIGVRSGIYLQAMEMVKIMLGPPFEDSLWMLLVIGTIFGGMVWWAVSQFLFAFRMGMNAGKNISELKGGTEFITRTAENVVKLGDQKRN